MKDIVLLHGALGSELQLKAISKELEKNYRVHLLEFSGHGRKEINNGFGIERFVLDLKELIERENLVKPDVFGFSMGGYVAACLSLQEPEMLGKIFTLGTKWWWDPEIAAKEVRKLDPQKIREKVPAFAKYLEKQHGEKWPELLQATGEMMRKMGDKPPLHIDDFQSIRNSVCLAIGDRDEMVSLQETVDVYKYLSVGALNVLPFTFHPLEKANVRSLAGEILNFLSRED